MLIHTTLSSLAGLVVGLIYGLSFGLIKRKALFILIGFTFIRLSFLAYLFYILQSYSLNLILTLITFLLTFWIIILIKARHYEST